MSKYWYVFTSRSTAEELLTKSISSELGGEGAGYELRLTVRNAGTGTMPVQVAAQRGERFQDPGGEDAALFHEARTTIILGAGEAIEVAIPCAFEPERVVIDPDALVLQRGRKRALHRF